MKRSPKRGVAVSRPVFGEVRADAAGIDVHSEENWVAVPPDKPGPTVRKFGACTADLHQLADWLQACGVKTVAMESTGVYWIPLFGILEARGLQVFLVNARHAKNVPGRPKTDCLDCQWLQKLHACGLLNASFRPDDSTCRLRTLLRYRDVLIKSLSCHTQRMQKALSEMNVLLHKVVSDITGSTGMRILEAILAGRRDYQRMAGELVDPQIQASAEQIGRALEGDYRPEQLFVLGQELEARRFVQQQIGACDGKIEEQLAIMQAAVAVPPDPPQPLTGAEKRRGNAPDFDVQSYLYRLTGVDLTRIPGIGASAALALTSETGIDMAPWRTDQAFASWSCLCPDTRISAGRSKGGRPQRSANRVKHIFRQCASTLRNSPTSYGAFYRRIRARAGTQTAITATARKLSCCYCRMLRHRQPYVEMGEHYYDQRYHDRVLRQLKQKARRYGYRLIQDQEPPTPPTP